MTEHQSLDNYYTKEQIDSSINAVNDVAQDAMTAAMAVPQTYNIEWLMNLFSATENNVTITAERFNEIKAAIDERKIFVGYGQVLSSFAYSDGGRTYITLTQLSENFVNVYYLSSVKYNASLSYYQIITQNDLSGYAKSSDIPTKTSQLTNDSNFLTEIPIASGTKVGGIKVSTNSGYSISNTGLFELNSATSTSKGIVSIGTGLTVNSGKVTLNTATSSNLGGVIVPNNGTISVDTSGNISVSDKVALKTDLDSKQDAITYSSSSSSNVTLTANSLIDLGTRSSAITVLLPSTASSDHKEY